MSRRYEKRTRSYEETYLAERKCDLCGVVAKTPENWSEHSAFDVDETEVKVTVRQKEGSSYPEGGSGTEHVIDLCPKCFKERLIPWLRSQGADVQEKEWYW